MSILNAITELLFPPRCLVCDQVIERSKSLCDSCGEELSLWREGVLCPRCGKPAGSCICSDDGFSFSHCVSAVIYNDGLAHAIDVLKKQPQSHIAKDFAILMTAALAQRLPEIKADWITSVPMQEDKRRERGHNQAETLAREIALLLKLSYIEPPLLRTQESETQHRLSAVRRAINASASYQRKTMGSISGCVILVDDVATTCSTLERCAALLRECGAREVICITVATTILKKEKDFPTVD